MVLVEISSSRHFYGDRIITVAWDPNRLLPSDSSDIRWLDVKLPQSGFYSWSERAVSLNRGRSRGSPEGVAEWEIDSRLPQDVDYTSHSETRTHSFFWDGKSEQISWRGHNVAQWTLSHYSQCAPSSFHVSLSNRLKMAGQIAPLISKPWNPMTDDLKFDHDVDKYGWIMARANASCFVKGAPGVNGSKKWFYLEVLRDCWYCQIGGHRNPQKGCSWFNPMFTALVWVTKKGTVARETIKRKRWGEVKNHMRIITWEDYVEMTLKVLLLRKVVRRYQNDIIERLWRPGGLMCERGWREVSDLVR